MFSIRACFTVVPVAFVIVACGGSSTTVDDVGTDSGAGADGTTTPGDDAAMGTDTGSGADTSVTDSGTGPDTAFIGDSALTLDGNDGGGCPNTLGGYSLLVATGLGCGDLKTTAKQCIVPGGIGPTSNKCFIRFNSEQPGPDRAVNGPNGGGLDLKSDGTFDNAALKEGSINRTGCTGSFDSATQTMTVICGGTGTSQSCTVTMVRSSLTCP